MEIGIIIHLALFFISALAIIMLLAWAFCLVVLEEFKQWEKGKMKRFFRWVKKRIGGFYQGCKERWNNLPVWCRVIYIILLIVFIAIIIPFLFRFSHGFFDYIFLGKIASCLKIGNCLDVEALSNIRRNVWLLGFAIFGGCLAIWARWTGDEQLKYTRKKLLRSEQKDYNDRFIKAVEMLDNADNKRLSREGLITLRDLADESPKTQYIRCAEHIAYLLASHEDLASKRDLLNLAVGIFKIKNVDKFEVEKIVKDNRSGLWPNLRGANLQFADFGGVVLQNSNLQDANLQNVYFGDANLQGANLRNANLYDADFGSANLQNANLDDANLEKAYLEYANFQGAKMHRADLQDAYLFGANLRNARLAHVKLQGAGLMQADLQNANLWNANLESAILRDTNLQGANLKNANLQFADLQNANLEDAILTNADMRDIVDLAKEQILSAKWKFGNGEGKPPKLSNYLLNDLDVQKWLSKSADGKIRKAKKSKAKKAIAKKSVASKTKIKSSKK